MTTKRECSAKVPDMHGTPNVHPCMRSATVERDGQGYCWQHAAMWKRRARNARLAELVTPELAELLDWLARYEDVKAKRARALAARIREALEMNDED